MFPAGLVSRKQKGKIVDLEWKTNFIKKSVVYKRDIIPVHITGRNTNFFYNLANWRKRLKIKTNIEMLYLADEFYKQGGENLVISFGKPVSYEEISNEKDKSLCAKRIKEIVYSLDGNLS
jgi:putative hemolysin